MGLCGVIIEVIIGNTGVLGAVNAARVCEFITIHPGLHQESVEKI